MPFRPIGWSRSTSPAIAPIPVLGERLLIDSHDAPVAAPVWALFERFVERAGARPTLIERDAELPPFAELLAERDRAHERLAAAVAAS